MNTINTGRDSMGQPYYCTKADLLEGCYHEMGHVLATLHFFPKDGRIVGIQFAKNYSGCLFENFNTIYNSYQWSFPSQKDAFTIICIGGGIFQQMKLIYNNSNCRKKGFNLIEKLQAIFNPDKALLHLFKRKVKSEIDGMEIDLDDLRKNYQLMLSWGLIEKDVDLEPYRIKAISLFFPFVKNKKIDALCDDFCNKILNQAKTNCNSIYCLLDIKKISKAIE